MTLFCKMQAAGNDFIFLNHEAKIDYSAVAVRWCHRRLGIGADGLLTVEPGSGPPMVRMWNPDGSEDFCGNGLCCAAHLCHIQGLLTSGQLRTSLGSAPVTADNFGSYSRVTLGLGPPELRAGHIPTLLQDDIHEARESSIEVLGEIFDVIPISTGSTHCVIFVDELPDDARFRSYSPAIEHHPVFPRRTSVLWVKVEPSGLSMRIWERGVGETFGCGTGASAAASAAILTGRTESPVAVHMTGGTSKVRYRRGESVWLTTDAHMVFEGSIKID